jgi:hypothetical protein
MLSLGGITSTVPCRSLEAAFVPIKARVRISKPTATTTLDKPRFRVPVATFVCKTLTLNSVAATEGPVLQILAFSKYAVCHTSQCSSFEENKSALFNDIYKIIHVYEYDGCLLTVAHRQLRVRLDSELLSPSPNELRSRTPSGIDSTLYNSAKQWSIRNVEL